MPKLTVVMPAWNEAAGLSEFLEELFEHLVDWHPQFVIVDDCSLDSTVDVALTLKQSGFPLDLVENSRNVGHGPSTVKALREGLQSGADVVVAVDGDGQFLGRDVRRLVQEFSDSKVDIIEGVRKSRGDPLYRQIVSVTTRLLVATRSSKVPADANTPLRVYSRAALEKILPMVPADARTPNLIISSLVRHWNFRILEMPVSSIPRRGGDPAGSTWGQKHVRLPSRRFMIFCFRAAWDWVSYDLPQLSQRPEQ